MTLPAPYYQRGNVTLYHADCLTVLPHLSGVDAVVTDPPYGVNLGHHAAAVKTSPRFLAKGAYASYEDTPENYRTLIVPRITAAIGIAQRALVFAAGTQMWLLPQPAAVSSVFLPAGCGRHKWGFQCHAHFVLYGDCPDLHMGAKPTGWSSTESAEACDHPCPKPIRWMVRCVLLASREGELVCDPFTGSGTTGVACIQTGRAFIGCELESKYCAIAARRFDEAFDSQALYAPVPKQTQSEMFAEVRP